MIRRLLPLVSCLLVAAPALADEGDEAAPAVEVGSVETPDERLPGDFWVGYRPEFGLIGMTGPVFLNRAEIGAGGRMGALRVWGFFDVGVLHSLDPGGADQASSVPAVTLEGGLHVAGAKPIRRGEWFIGPRFSFGGLDFDLVFSSIGAGTGVILGRWDRKAWLRLGLDIVAVFPWRLPEYTTLGIAISASVLIR
jgi:hypothetical protein